MVNVWEQIRATLGNTVNPGLFKVWIKPLTAEVKGDILHLYAPNEFVATWVRDRLLQAIQEAAATAMGFRPQVRITAAIAAKQSAPATAPAVPGLIVGGTAGARKAEALAEETGEDLGPAPRMPDVKRASWRFSFEDFVVGPSNELAYAATRGLSHKTLDSDQLFLSSSPGLGKTHLLQAVGRQFCTTSNRDRVRVEYLTAESFCTQLIMALRSKQMDQFKARFREGLDVLLLEDIHFLQGKEKIQAELLETLKYLELSLIHI